MFKNGCDVRTWFASKIYAIIKVLLLKHTIEKKVQDFKKCTLLSILSLQAIYEGNSKLTFLSQYKTDLNCYYTFERIINLDDKPNEVNKESFG